MDETSESLARTLYSPELVDKLAAIEHERWSDWQGYLHAQCARGENGSLVIPRELVDRWNKQMATPFHELTEREKESDREQVRRYLPIIATDLRRDSAGG